MRLCEDEVIGHDGISYEQAMALIQCEELEEIHRMMQVAGNVARRLHKNRVHLCGIVNAKSGLCPEDCAFCAQSLRFPTQVPRYPLLDIETVVTKAQEAKANGATEFCIVTSGRSLNPREFERLLLMVQAIKEKIDIHVDVSLGFLNLSQARRLKAAGVRRVNHNVQTASTFYSHIVSTHPYAERIQTLCAIRAAGLEVCCGVILGMGESRQQRIDAAFEIKPLEPHCVPVNLLDPRPGTPLANQALMEPMEILKTIAIFRLILPRTCLKLAGGRQVQLGPYQRLALQAGINGLIIGPYLTTQGNPLREDFENLRASSLEWAGECS